ncbi:MAG: 7-carboxy-7-deazaguanine synthase [Saprospiraceae bacterium]
MYSLKEIFYTLQGEGRFVGRPAIFMRFAGCNLWTGHERHRASAICKFCDTDFVGTNGPGGGKYTSKEITDIITSMWPDPSVKPFIVCTGGEPALQLDEELITALHAIHCFISIETNGTIALPLHIDWVCVSPKSNTDLVMAAGDELKLVYPQTDALPHRFEKLEFSRFSLQPMDGPDREKNILATLEYCKAHPLWTLSLQTHKILNIP